MLPNDPAPHWQLIGALRFLSIPFFRPPPPFPPIFRGYNTDDVENEVPVNFASPTHAFWPLEYAQKFLAKDRGSWRNYASAPIGGNDGFVLKPGEFSMFYSTFRQITVESNLKQSENNANTHYIQFKLNENILYIQFNRKF